MSGMKQERKLFFILLNSFFCPCCGGWDQSDVQVQSLSYVSEQNCLFILLLICKSYERCVGSWWYFDSPEYLKLFSMIWVIHNYEICFNRSSSRLLRFLLDFFLFFPHVSSFYCFSLSSIIFFLFHFFLFLVCVFSCLSFFCLPLFRGFSFSCLIFLFLFLIIVSLSDFVSLFLFFFLFLFSSFNSFLFVFFFLLLVFFSFFLFLVSLFSCFSFSCFSFSCFSFFFSYFCFLFLFPFLFL